LLVSDEAKSAETSSGALPSTSELARQRTYLAAERTLFAVLRTGLAIAAGGSVIVSLLGDEWPSWVQVPLAAVFLIVGYYLMLHGLRRYRGIADRVRRQDGIRLEIMPARTMIVLTVVLDVTITIVLTLFLVGAFA
jgi:uncharacterized membrane protein YidH (DUF202 family)